MGMTPFGALGMVQTRRASERGNTYMSLYSYIYDAGVRLRQLETMYEVVSRIDALIYYFCLELDRLH